MNEADSSRDPEWRVDGPTGSDALNDMVATLSDSKIVVPRVPLRVEEQLLATTDGWAWGTQPSVAPMAAYLGFDWDSQKLAELLHPSHDDFWMWAHRGHGANSYGAGLFARVGPIVIFQQTLFGGAFMDPAMALDRLNAANRAWNETLDAVEFMEGPPRVAVLWSDYRQYAHILLSPEVTGRFDSPDPSGLGDYWPLEGWADLAPDGGTYTMIDPAVAVAVKHLFKLEESCRDSSAGDAASAGAPSQDGPREAAGSSKPDPSEESADPHTEAEDVLLSVDDLVKSVLELGTANFSALRENLSERVSLLRLELGAVDGELSGFGSLFSEDLFNGVCGDPFTDHRVIYLPGLEAPRFLAEPTNEMGDRIDDLRWRSEDLRDEIASLRREWLRAVLIQAEPALEHRRTTERRLQQRGLGPRPRPPVERAEWEDWDIW